MKAYPFRYSLGDKLELTTPPDKPGITTRSGTVIALELSARGTSATLRTPDDRKFVELESNLRPIGQPAATVMDLSINK